MQVDLKVLQYAVYQVINGRYIPYKQAYGRPLIVALAQCAMYRCQIRNVLPETAASLIVDTYPRPILSTPYSSSDDTQRAA